MPENVMASSRFVSANPIVSDYNGIFPQSGKIGIVSARKIAAMRDEWTCGTGVPYIRCRIKERTFPLLGGLGSN